MWLGLEIGFICLAYNHNKLHLLKIFSSTDFAFELALALEFLWDQLA
jgi:hypothetical protein